MHFLGSDTLHFSRGSYELWLEMGEHLLPSPTTAPTDSLFLRAGWEQETKGKWSGALSEIWHLQIHQYE